MPRDDLIETEGQIEDALGGGQYSIRTSSGQIVRAKVSGKLKKNHIRVLPGDLVKVSVSPYDMTHGIITFREKNARR